MYNNDQRYCINDVINGESSKLEKKDVYLKGEN